VRLPWSGRRERPDEYRRPDGRASPGVVKFDLTYSAVATEYVVGRRLLISHCRRTITL
jgi:hypothetical protein